MPRSVAAIQAEITAIEGTLAASDGNYTTLSADGVTRTINRSALESRLDQLYMQLGRANGSDPMFVRGHIRNLRS